MSVRARCKRGAGSGSDSSLRGASGTGGSSITSNGGACSTVSSCGSRGAGGASVLPSAACFWAASVARKSSASGPSRMLARFRAIEHLLREVSVRLRGAAGRVVREHRGSLHGRLGVADRLADARVEHEIAEVLLENVHRLAGMQRAVVEHRRQNPLNLYLRVKVLTDHAQRV